MQLNGEKVVAAIGVNGDVLALTDEGRVYVRKWSEQSHAYDWSEQTPVPLKRGVSMPAVQSVA